MEMGETYRVNPSYSGYCVPSEVEQAITVLSLLRLRGVWKRSRTRGCSVIVRTNDTDNQQIKSNYSNLLTLLATANPPRSIRTMWTDSTRQVHR